jgi:hypothetical protein
MSAAYGDKISATQFAISLGSSTAGVLANYGVNEALGNNKSCFVAGTKLLTVEEGEEREEPIEDVELGTRVAADESLCADVDVNGWTEYDFVGTSDTSFRVSLLRPSSWGAQLALGAQLFMTMSEFNVSDWVQLVHVEAGPVDAGGAGCPVITTFARTAHDVIELNIAGDDAPMHVTSGHKFYSATRHDWVRAKMLQVGEQLVTHEGTTTVEGIDLRARAAATVFNVVRSRGRIRTSSAGRACGRIINTRAASLAARMKRRLRRRHILRTLTLPAASTSIRVDRPRAMKLETRSSGASPQAPSASRRRESSQPLTRWLRGLRRGEGLVRPARSVKPL